MHATKDPRTPAVAFCTRANAGVTAFNLDDTTSNYSGTPSIRKKSFQIYSGAAQEELEPLNNININNTTEGVFDTSRCWNTVKCLFNGVICSHKFKNVQPNAAKQLHGNILSPRVCVVGTLWQS
uniref:Uncharacterized protein n=1 Tax=Anopheles culicifacies TaxID=139723 RepID=A0A182MHU5_9DIPT